ncbi:hypothetical protein [uncultured Deefgea sp.]|uniref:hypothetical protein n=1 Tax=uncultured Deefgea sp. TaxID=1304914 RepID=UPI00260E216F|nr:hypothetical protein [uncultured Deefgea sp.]
MIELQLTEQAMRQQRVLAVAQSMFLEPVGARSQCLALLDEARAVFDAPCLIDCAVLLSQIEDQLGDLNHAIRCLTEALVYAEEFKQTQRMPEILEQIGRCYYSQACYPQALEHWQQCAVICGKQTAFLKTRSLALMGLGQICDAGGDYVLAEQMQCLAHGLLTGHSEVFLLVKAKINWAVSLKKIGEIAAATALLRDALQRCLQQKLPHYAATSLYRLAEIKLETGDLISAEGLIADGLAIVASTPYHWAEANLLALSAQLMAKKGQPLSALAMIQRGLLIAKADGLRHIEMRLSEQAERYARSTEQFELADDLARRVNFILLHLNAAMVQHIAPDLSGLSELLI